MHLKNTILALSMLICAQAIGMKAPQQKPAEYPMNSLLGLPPDVKRYLLPFIIQGDQRQMEMTIFSLAATSKEFKRIINELPAMSVLLNCIFQKLPLNNVFELVKKLQKKEKTLSILRDPAILEWIAQAEKYLIDAGQIPIDAGQIHIDPRTTHQRVKYQLRKVCKIM
jgi:hypothetical protein